MITETKVYFSDTKAFPDDLLYDKMYHTVSEERQAKIDRLQQK